MREGWLPMGHLYGLTLSNDAGDTTNDVGIAAGTTRSSVNSAYVYNNAYSSLARHQRDIEITDALIKQLDVVWAPGNGGGRSAATLADGTWHALAIGGKGLKDSVILHNSLTQSSVFAALPSGYTAYRRIWSVVRSTSILAFTQTGDHCQWATVKADQTAASLNTTAVLLSITVPTGVKVLARLQLNSNDSDAEGVYVSSPDATDEAADTTINANAFSLAASRLPLETVVLTNTSAQVRARSASGAHSLRVNTKSYTDTRGRDA